jgi:hypothetical protein
MIRTIWLALFCLISLATIASVKFVSSAWGTRVENPSAQFEKASVGLNAKNEESAKADRLTVNVELASETVNVELASETTPVIPVKIDPVDASVHPGVSESVKSHHWDEPKDSARQFRHQSERKNRNNKRKMVSVRSSAAECSDKNPQTILQSLNLSPRCGVASTLAAKRANTANSRAHPVASRGKFHR